MLPQPRGLNQEIRCQAELDGMPLPAASHTSVRLLCLDRALALHVFIGESEKFFRPFARIVRYCKSDAALDGEGEVAVDNQLTKLLLNAVHDDVDVFCARVDEQGNKLIGAVSGNQVGASGRFE